MLDRVRVASATLAAALCAPLALALAGCGTAAGPPPGPRITLKLTGPADESRVSATTATITGRVSPIRARVEVLGAGVPVARDGSFSLRVGLAPGTNLIDVEASAPRSTGAVAAVRVIRYLLVSVPQLNGESPAQATSELRALGLAVKIVGSSDPLSFLLPGSATVCSSTPAAGTRVNPGSTVAIKTSKLCF